MGCCIRQNAIQTFGLEKAPVWSCSTRNDCVEMAVRPSETTNLLNNVRSDDIERGGPSTNELVVKRQSRPDGE